MAYATVSVKNIAPTANEDDVLRFFRERIPDSDPIVSPLIQDTNSPTKSTTITFKGKNKAACQKSIRSLSNSSQCDLSDSAGITSTLSFSGDFLGLTVLANNCAPDEDPYFDVYFVHGLGGHAYNSFRSKPNNHRKSKMWVRDLLPIALDRPGKRGRYLTFGYSAPVMESDIISQSIEETAVNLLSKIMNDRRNNCKRPMFFVCHSLGGLVVCQAMLLALGSKDRNEALTDIQKAFSLSGHSLIKGIIYFGTPFRGSRSANLGVKIAAALRLPLNNIHMMYLRVKDQDVSRIMDDFEKRVDEFDIPLLIFYELRKTRVLFFKKLVVHQDSAKGRFRVQLPRYGLRADHHKLVKFSPADRLYEDDVKPYIQQIVHKALDDLSKGTRFAAFRESGVVLGEPPELRRSRSRTPQVTTTSEGFPPRAGLVPLGPKIDNAHAEALAMKPGLTGIDENRIGEWIQETINELGYYHSNRQMDSIDEGSRSTCDWILSKPLFRLWASSSTNAILFVEGSAGLGKSVLAKFVVGLFKSATGWEDFDETDQQKTTSINKSTAITAHFFCKRTGSLEKYNSPKIILMHILFQIWEADPECFRLAALSLFNRVNERRGFEFYWSLFNAVRRQLNRPLFCIIDGLDECIHEYKSRSKADVKEKMEKFLKNLCSLAKEQQSGRIEEATISPTKVLLTTRPALEVDNATFGSNFVLPIQETDTKECVKSFIEESVRALSQRHRLSEPTEQFIKDEIAKKSGHVFQTARTALTNLTKEWHDLEDKNLVARLLERVNSRNLDDAYEETLENIPIADQVKASRIIRILYFAQAELKVEKLSHIFLDKVDNPTSILDFTSSKGSLEVFVRSNLGQLIKIDDEGVVEFQHQTIREFFSDLSPSRWPLYNCKDAQAGHLHLALLCIQYLLSWRHQTVSPEELENWGGNEDVARFDQSKFLFYASDYWEDHVREAGNLIVPHISLVDKLLGFGDNDTDDYRYMCLLRTIDPDHDWRPVLPTSFIASFNLVHVLKAHIKPKVEVRRSRLGFLRPEKPKVHECNGLDPDLRNWDDSTALHHASRNASVEAALYLLDCGSDPTTRDSQNHTPFSLAVQAGCVEIAEVLAERLQSFHEVDMERNPSILHRACAHGMHKVVARLVSIGADPNSTNIRGKTPIMVAAAVGHAETVKVLIKEHVIIDFKMPDGTTALHVAAKFGHVGVLELLFTAEPALDPAPANSNGDTPLHLALRYEHFECFKYLYSLKPVVQENSRGWLPVHQAACNGHTSIINYLKDRANITALTKEGFAPLHCAAANGHLDAVKLLVKLGCEFGMGIDTRCDDLTLPEDDRLPNLVTPLYFAALLGHRSTIEFLISQNADITVHDSYGHTLLHDTARYDFSDLFQLLLNRGLDPFARAAHGFTPLFFAAHAGSVDIVEIYLNMDDSQREYLDLIDSDGDTALYAAVSANNTVIATKLILRGIGIGSSCLHAAARLEDISVLTLLLDRDTSVDHADSHGRTALHVAAERCNLAACEVLVERGANKNAVSKYGQTPLMETAERFSTDCVRYFLGIHADAFMYDASGLSVFDYCENFAPIMDLLRPLIAQGSLLSFEERQCVRRANVRKFLGKLNKTDPTSQDFKSEPLQQLRLCFLHMKDYDAARVCSEHSFRKSGKDETIHDDCCDKCRDIGNPGSFWECKTCANTGLCNPCYEKHIDDDPVVGCSADHEYLELGGERWKNLEKGKVNAEGQTLKEWINAMIEKYGVEDEATAADANPGGCWAGNLVALNWRAGRFNCAT